MEEASGGWRRIWDETAQHYYWYNDHTQESQWEDAGTDVTGPGAGHDHPNGAWDNASPQGGHASLPRPPKGAAWEASQEQWAALGMLSSSALPGRSAAAPPSRQHGGRGPGGDPLTSDEEEEEEEDDDDDEKEEEEGDSGNYDDDYNDEDETLPPRFPPVNPATVAAQPSQPRSSGEGSDRRGGADRAGATLPSATTPLSLSASLPSPRAKPRGVGSRRRLRRYQAVLAETNDAVACHTRCFFCHAVVCEAPLAAAEALLRAPLCLVLGACAALAGLGLCAARHGTGRLTAAARRRRERLRHLHGGGDVRTPMAGLSSSSSSFSSPPPPMPMGDGSFVPTWAENEAWRLSLALGREGVLFLASAMIYVPGVLACTVYRGFADTDHSGADRGGGGGGVDDDDDDDDDDDEAGRGGWSLRALPTVVGWVDPRRFACIALFGQGSGAANADLELQASDGGTASGPVPGTAAARAAAAQGSMDGGCCPGPVLLAPRNCDRGLSGPAAALARSLLSFFADDGGGSGSGVSSGAGSGGVELLSTLDDEDDEEGEEEEGGDFDRHNSERGVQLA